MDDSKRIYMQQKASNGLGIVALIILVVVTVYQWVGTVFVDNHELNFLALYVAVFLSLILGVLARKSRFGKSAIIVSIFFIVYLLMSYLFMMHAMRALRG
jgi:hypothetical protein